MTLAELLRTLRKAGIALAVENDALRIQAPKGAVTPDLRERLLEHKQALVHWLRESATDDGLPLPQYAPDPEHLYEPFPLSDLQLGFYMADDPYMEFHVRPHYYIEKDLDAFDIARYERAWQRALARHAHEIVIVRTDGLLETVRDPTPLTVKIHDLRHMSTGDAETELQAIRSGMMRGELPLDRWPWLDLRVSIRSDDAGDERFRIHYNHNNFFSDGFGTTRLLQEVDRCYADPDLVLPPIELGFRDAALALEDLADSTLGHRARQYWESRLPTLPGPPGLPLKPNMERRCRSRLTRREGFLPASSWDALKRHAAHAGLSPSNAVFAAYAEVIATWSNSRHFVLSNMMTRRLNVHPQMRDIIGNFASLYPLEIDLRDRTSFADSARRIQEQVITDARHLHWGGMRVLQALGRLQGGIGRAAIPFVIGSGLFMEGFTRSDFSCLETSQVMLDHQFWELPDGRFYFVWDLLEEFFPDGMIDDMWSAYLDMLQRLADDLSTWERSRFDLVPAGQLLERASPTVDWDGLPETCLGDLLGMSAIRAPEAVATWTPAGPVDHGRLHTAAHEIACRLRASGLRHGERVAILADRGAMLLAAVHGTLMAGGVYLPLDPDLPTARLHYLLTNSGTTHLLAQADHADAHPWPVEVRVERLVDTITTVGTSIDPPMPVAPMPSTRPTDLAYLIYTSGSTGVPKGVMIDHRGAINTVLDINARYGVGPHDRLFGASSFSFDLSVYDIFGAAAAGASLVYPEPTQALNPAHWLDLMLDREVTIWNSAPQLAALLVEAAELRGCGLPALRLVMLSGDWIPVDLPDRIRRVAPNARVVSLGGATEASIWSIAYDIDEVDPEWPSIPYGRPMRNQSWAVLDEWGRPAPIWVPGDLYIGGVGLAMGYWGDEEKTRAAFGTDPDTGERRYRTGDIGRYLPGGLIEFLGRKDFQVKIQGHRIELGEIESQLCTHPDVAAAVVTVQKPADGGSAQLVAHVVTNDGAPANTPVLREHMARKLPDYMVPRLFNTLPRLPININGKVDRKALPRVEEARETAAKPSIRRAPADALEEKLLALWRDVLRQQDLGTGDDFFDRGGQSFEAVRLVGLIRETCGITFTLGDIWQARTVAGLADIVRTRRTGAGRDTRALVDLRKSPAHGKTPLFLVHPAGGQVIGYRHLAQLQDRAVYGFRAAGADGESPPRDSLDAMAEAYLKELTNAHPHGAVLLGGWSSGAPIAFEMARRLRETGRDVEGLVLFDSPAADVCPEVPPHRLFEWFVEDLDPSTTVLEALRAVPPGTGIERRLDLLVEWMGRNGGPGQVEASQIRTIYEVFRATVRATRTHLPQATDVDILLLRANDGEVSEFVEHPRFQQTAWGWSQLTSGSVEVVSLPGTHHTLLLPGQVEQAGRVLQAWIERRRTLSPSFA